MSHPDLWVENRPELKGEPTLVDKSLVIASTDLKAHSVWSWRR